MTNREKAIGTLARANPTMIKHILFQIAASNPAAVNRAYQELRQRKQVTSVANKLGYSSAVTFLIKTTKCTEDEAREYVNSIWS